MSHSISCDRCRPGRRCLSHTVLPFGKYQGKTFDEADLPYLDWLSGQKFVYGELRKRLTRYLTRPCIQQELERLFPDRELESNGFTVAGTYGDRSKYAWADYGRPEWLPRDWHRDSAWEEAAARRRMENRITGRPEEANLPRYRPAPMRSVDAWETAADFLLALEDVHDPNDLLGLDLDRVRQACHVLPPQVAERLRREYGRVRDRMRRQPARSANTLLRLELLREVLAELGLENLGLIA